jgi:two-component system NtrC family sensor kinase
VTRNPIEWVMNWYLLPPFFTLVCFVSLGLFVFFKGRQEKADLLFVLLCVQGSFLNIDILLISIVSDAETALWVSRIDHLFLVHTIPLYLHFFYTYLHIHRRGWLIPCAYVYSFLLMFFTPTSLYIPSMQRYPFGYIGRSGPLYPLFGLGALMVTLYSLWLIYQTIQAESNSIRKNKLKYVFVGFGLMGLMNSLNIFPILGYSVYPPGNFSFIPLSIFAFGLFKHDLFDTGVLVKKSLIYSFLIALLTAAYALLVTLANKLFSEYRFSESIYFSILFFLFVAFVFGPLKTKVQIQVDRIFFKGKYDYQRTIKAVSRVIASCLTMSDIMDRLMDTVMNTMLIKTGAVFVWEPKENVFKPYIAKGENAESLSKMRLDLNNPLVHILTKERQPLDRRTPRRKSVQSNKDMMVKAMDHLCAWLVVPMIFTDNFKGLLILGKKRSGDIYTAEDTDLLMTLADQSAVAIENAHAYEMIEDLNLNLEKKIKQRTEELEKALLEKERTQEHLIRSESLSALGQLVAGVAHELNNPLTSVTSLIQSVVEDIEENDLQIMSHEEVVDDLKFSLKELARAKGIVSSLLGLSRQTQTYTEAVDMNLVVKDALRILYNQYKHLGLHIVTAYDEHLPHVRGNFTNLGQVVINIIQNAVQAVSENGGQIILGTSFDPAHKHVLFMCQDTGPGMPQDIQQNIFKPFFTTKEVGRGTGLGLYICHEIIRRHKGSITVESAQGNGAIFTVALNASQE